MKFNYHGTFFVIIILLFAPMLTARHKIHQSSHSFEKMNSKEEAFNPTFLLHSIEKDLQDPKYRQDILPSNFSYPIQLLDHGKRTNQSSEFAQDIFSLFSKLIKGAEYVNCYALSSFIEKIPDLTKHYFNGYQLESAQHLILANDLDMLERLQKAVTSIVYTKFAYDFSLCKEKPEQFLNDLAQRIISATTQEVKMEQLRQTIIRFLEVALSKLIWSPKDGFKSWEIAKKLSHQLASLMEYNIIEDHNDIDELFWTLIHRYRYFLELHHTDMSLTFYQKLKTDMQQQKILLFELEEQEPFLQTKQTCLLSTVLAQEAKKRASHYKYKEGQIA